MLGLIATSWYVVQLRDMPSAIERRSLVCRRRPRPLELVPGRYNTGLELEWGR